MKLGLRPTNFSYVLVKGVLQCICRSMDGICWLSKEEILHSIDQSGAKYWDKIKKLWLGGCHDLRQSSSLPFHSTPSDCVNLPRVYHSHYYVSYFEPTTAKRLFTFLLFSSSSYGPGSRNFKFVCGRNTKQWVLPPKWKVPMGSPFVIRSPGLT